MHVVSEYINIIRKFLMDMKYESNLQFNQNSRLGKYYKFSAFKAFETYDVVTTKCLTNDSAVQDPEYANLFKSI